MKTIYLIVVTSLVLTSCKKDEPIPAQLPQVNDTGKLEIRFSPSMNGAPFQLNQVFTGPNNLRMNVELFKFYLSSITIHDTTDQLIKDVALVDFSKLNKSVIMDVPVGDYTNLKFGIGLSKIQNGTGNPDFNPANFPIEHPQSIYNDMYWTNSTRYVFLKIEGKIDTSAAQNTVPTYTWFYHTGKDTMYTPVAFNNLNFSVNKGQTTVLEFGVEVNDLFINQTDTINMVADNYTHTTDFPVLARKVISNLGRAIRKL
jgi:hypothetical protein